MLKEIINNLSYSDKYSLLTDIQIDFLSSLTREKQAAADISNMIYQELGIKCLIEPESLGLIIERMKPQQVDDFLSNLSCQTICLEDAELSLKYKILKSLAIKEPEIFFEALGLSSSLEDFKRMGEKVQGTERVDPVYPLYDYQSDCSNRIRSLINMEGSNKALLHLPTGAGKTRTALNIVCDYLRQHPSALVVWLADTKELCEQAVEEFKKAWLSLGSHSLPVYSFFGDSELSISGLSKGFLVAGLQKLNSLESKSYDALQLLYRALRKKASLIVFDEAHLAIAPTYSSTVNSFLLHSENESFLLGLSATPGRVMGNSALEAENKRLSDFFDNNKVTMRVKGYHSPLEYLIEHQYLAKAKFIELNYDDIDLSTYLSSRQVHSSEVLQALSTNDNRNIKLVDTILKELENADSQIIVFACTVEHARQLSMILNSLSIASRSIDGSTPKIIRSASIADYRNREIRVLVNYGVLTAGFDAPCTNVSIIARPTNSLVQYSQMAGRAMRGKRSGGNEICRVYTVNDNLPEFRSVRKAFSYWDQMWKSE